MKFILKNRKYLSAWLLLMAGLLNIVPALADEPMGQVIRSQNMTEYPVGKMLMENTEIRTRNQQRIAVKTRQGDVLVANENARIKLVKPGFFSQLFGKIYYFIAPRRDGQVRVNTNTATIGIRGTRFIVDSAEANTQAEQVSLLTGELRLDSKDDEQFALYEQKEMSEYERYRREMMGEFEAYKQQMMEEFVAYKSSINLDSGFALQFDGKKVIRKPVDDSVQQDAADFEEFLAQARAQSIR